MEHGLYSTLHNLGFVNSREEVTPEGLHALAYLLKRLPAVHRGLWHEAFVPLMEKIVPVTVELVIVEDQHVLLVWREDEFFGRGYGFPGSYRGPRETLQDTVSRCAKRELGVDVTLLEKIGEIDKINCPRFHDFSLLVLCQLRDDEPKYGEWFNGRPRELLAEFESSWPLIEKYLKK